MARHTPDRCAGGVILGVLDVLNARLDLWHEYFVIGRNTGQAEFPAHIRMLGRFGTLQDFLFVLAGFLVPMEEQINAWGNSDDYISAYWR